MRLLLLAFSFLISGYVQAEEWVLLGASSVGKHYVDTSSLQRDANNTIFSVVTRVVQNDNAEWVTSMIVDCKVNTFAYASGIKLQNGQITSRFDAPKPAEPIVQDSMPDQLKKEYCVAAPPQWESLGKSSIADVYFDRNSVEQSSDGSRFKADTMVMPFNGQEETRSTVAFNCNNNTFNIVKLTKVKDGKLESVFETPQKPAQTSKVATLDTLARKFCGKPPAVMAIDTSEKEQKPEVTVPRTKAEAQCDKVLASLKSLESTIQKDFDDDGLQCKQQKSYLKQIQVISQNVKKYECAIGDLTAYAKDIQDAGCR